MLPEFPNAYEAIQKVWNRIFFDAAGFSDPLISQVAIRVQREGHRAFLGESETEYKAQSVSHGWQPEMGKGISTEEFFGTPARLGGEMATMQAKSVFEAMSESSPYAGSLRKDEGPITFDLWLQKMEDYELDFNEDGSPVWPQWYLLEDAVDEFKTSMCYDVLTPEQIQKQKDLVARKRKNFDERENNRRLVE